MNLPTTITPCPIVDAIFDVKFTSALPPDAVVGLLYNALKQLCPQFNRLPAADMPEKLRIDNPTFRYMPLARLVGKDMAVLIGPNVVGFCMHGEYPGWAQLSARVLEGYEKVLSSPIIGGVERFGLRYISFFQQDIFKNLALRIELNNRPINEAETQFSTILTRPGCRCAVRIAKDVKLSQDHRQGSVIDIDCFDNPTTSRPSLEAGRAFLDAAHTAEKTIFFDLLSPEFLETLRPTYA